MESIVRSLCLLCAMSGGAPQPELPQGMFGIWSSQERIGADEQLLRLSTSDFILDSDWARDGRLDAFARRFAEELCPSGFELSVAERASWPATSPRYAKQFIIRCQRARSVREIGRSGLVVQGGHGKAPGRQVSRVK